MLNLPEIGGLSMLELTALLRLVADEIKLRLMQQAGERSKNL